MTYNGDFIRLKEEELKLQLMKLHTKLLSWQRVDQELILYSMMKNIGSSDSGLRDTLIYGTFSNLILENKLSVSALEELLEECLSNKFLYNGIGESDTDSVFTRAFTTLLIALILFQDNKNDFLSVRKINEVKDSLIKYIRQEKDVRGFVPHKGWAHSIAHVSDTFYELIKNKKLDSTYYKEIVSVIWAKIFVSDDVYLHDEEERMLIPILEMLQRGLSVNIILELLESMTNELSQRKKKLPEQNYWYLVANCKNFLKTFYFVVSESNFKSLQPMINNVLLMIK